MRNLEDAGNEAEGCSDLLSKVGTVKISSEKLDRRVQPHHVVLNSSSHKDRKFSLQYCHSYNVRYLALKSVLQKEVQEEWIDKCKIPLKDITDLCHQSQNTTNVSDKSSPRKRRSDTPSDYHSHQQHITFQKDVTVAISGTIFKQQPEKPSILQELSEENPMVPLASKQSYISKDDYLILEDCKSRVRLILTPGCDFTVHEVVNGVVCAVKGKPTMDGKFEVHDVFWATPEPAVLHINPPFDCETVFVSGLHVGKPNSDRNDGFIDVLIDYLTGLVGSTEEQMNKISNQTRVFFIGNTLHKNDNAKQSTNVNDRIIENIKKFDAFLSHLAKSMEVFIIPGETDPVESMLPQPPIHRCIFPTASRLTTFNRLSNPTRLKLSVSESMGPENLLDIILSSGENVIDAMRNTNITSPAEMARRLLMWGHICPTAPDTLPLHPGCKEDEFIIRGALPHMFVVGNQKKFDTLDWRTTKIVTVPDFSETHCAVALTKEMECIPINIGDNI